MKLAEGLILTVAKGKYNMFVPMFLDFKVLLYLNQDFFSLSNTDKIEFLQYTMMPWYFIPSYTTQ